MDLKGLCPNEIVLLASLLSIQIAGDQDTVEIGLLASLFACIGDNLAAIAGQKAANDLLKDEKNSETNSELSWAYFLKSFILLFFVFHHPCE